MARRFPGFTCLESTYRGQTTTRILEIRPMPYAHLLVIAAKTTGTALSHRLLDGLHGLGQNFGGLGHVIIGRELAETQPEGTLNYGLG